MQKSRFLTLGLALLGSTLLTGCMGSKNNSLEEEVQQQKMELRQLQPAQADTMNQLQAMRQELDDIKGQLDDIKNAGGAKALVTRVNKHDAALRQIEASMAMNFNLGESVSQSTPPPASTAVAMVPVVQAPSTPGTYGQPNVADTPPGIEPWKNPQQPTTASNLPTGSTWGQATPQATAPTEPQKDISEALYDAGLNAYNSRNYTEAQRSFSDFLQNYSDHKLVPDAQFYLAECYFQKNQFSDAALAYNEVITKYSKSTRVPGAYLKQGICFSKSGQKAAAQARMQELIKKFPKSPEAARAKNFLKTNA
ncbi:MAG: tol-pal system protein YbgF [Desulfovibrionaceae bacterium]|nr:tol-pal system protein YbgF [Desulfovibrionaceae bacterium]